MTRETILRRVLAILQYAYPDASEWEADFMEDGHLRCLVDYRAVPAPPKEAYA